MNQETLQYLAFPPTRDVEGRFPSVLIAIVSALER
jgi:hypothetical protein